MSNHPTQTPGFTPGPWTTGPNNGGELCVYADTGKPEFPVCKFLDIIKPEINRANAHLIASAPDGYEANREAAQFLRSYFGPVSSDDALGWSDDDARSVYIKLRAAIAKAEGAS